MSKNIKKLEKESSGWKGKYEKNHLALLDLISEKQVRDDHIKKTAKQVFYLQKLCRTLQGDRTFLVNHLKANNIECPKIPEVQADPETDPVLPDFSTPALSERDQQIKSERLDTMTKDCADLKENLKMLQNQLASITDEKENESEAPVEKTIKKNKNKKSKTNKSDKNAKQQESKTNKQESNKTDIVSQNTDQTEIKEQALKNSSIEITMQENTPNSDVNQLNEVKITENIPKTDEANDLINHSDTDSAQLNTPTDVIVPNILNTNGITENIQVEEPQTNLVPDEPNKT